MEWCIDDTVDLLKMTPPPPLGMHDLTALVREYARLSKCAETESVDIYAGTLEFLKLQVKTRQCYGSTVMGYEGPLESADITLTVREATVDHVITQRLLSRFGVKMENMPYSPIEHDMAAAMMCSTDETRNAVGRYRRKLKRNEDRRRQREAERKEMLLKLDSEDNDDGQLGSGGI